MIHSLSGDLLYALRGPEICQHPRLVTIVDSGFVLVSYSDGPGSMALFSVNGEFCKHAMLEEQNLVSCVGGLFLRLTFHILNLSF